MMYTLIGLGGAEILFFLLAIVPFILLPILTLIDVLRSDFRQQNDKLIWVIVVVFMPVIGSFLYLIIGRNQQVA